MKEQTNRNNEPRPSAWIVQILQSSESTTPAAPELEAVLAAATSGSRQPSLKAGPLRPVQRGALGLGLIALLIIAVQIASTGLPRRFARLTPLTQVNAAWASAEGYVLEFEVFDQDASAGPEHSNSKPNYARFEKAAYAWADRQGLCYPKAGPEGSGLMTEDPGFVFWRTSGGTTTSQFSSSGAQISLRLDNLQLVENLSQTLSALPGVSQPVVSPRTMYFGLGGLSPVMDKAKVHIQGKSYDFPEDFSEWEAQDLYWMLRSARNNLATFRAFPDKFLAEPDGSRRFQLGDVIRSGLDSAGNLVISNVLEHWDVPAEKHSHIHTGIAGGWGFALPRGVDEASIDPVWELSRRFDPLPGDVERKRYTVHLYYWLVPRAQLLSQGGSSITAEQSKTYRTTAELLQQRLDAWVVGHPEVKRSLVFGHRVFGYPLEAGPNTVCFTVSVQTNDAAEAEPVKSTLAEVQGAPEPEVYTFDRDALRPVATEHP
jgi:hypothetical protein